MRNLAAFMCGLMLAVGIWHAILGSTKDVVIDGLLVAFFYITWHDWREAPKGRP